MIGGYRTRDVRLTPEVIGGHWARDVRLTPEVIGGYRTRDARLTPEVIGGRRTQDALPAAEHVGRGLSARAVARGDVLAGTSAPTWAVHGTEDAAIAPAAGEYALGKIPGASARWFPGVGHMPFAERAAEVTHAVRSPAGGERE